MADSISRWYADGLCFSCTQCGDCCRVEGHVWVDRQEIEDIARHLELELDPFGRRFLRRVGNRLSLIEKSTHECIFWDDGCSIYPVRPSQCRTFPFWDSHLKSSTTWDSAARECEGIGDGLLYTLQEIEVLSKGQGATSEEPPSSG